MAPARRSDSPSASDPRAESLRERRRRQTTDEISSVALRLFDEQGFAETTVDDIAATAGVSRATFFRYFRSKEEAALHELIDLPGDLDRRSQESSAVEPTLPALTEITADLLSRVTPPQMAQYAVLRRLVEREEALQQAADAHCHALAERIRSRLLANGNPQDRFGARVIAETTVALLQATLDEWADSPGEDLASMYREAVERLRQCALGS